MTRGTTSLALAVWLLALVLVAAPVALAAEGDTNFTNVVASGDITAGDELIVVGAVDITGVVEFNGDITVKGNGTDILFDTANQNTIGATAKGAKVVFARQLEGETGTALTIKSEGDTAINIVADGDGTGDTADIILKTGNATTQWTVDEAGDLTAAAANVLNVDTIEDAASTGKPSFTYGLTIPTNQSIAAGADGTVTIGASGTEIGTVWVQTVDDGDGTVAVAAALTVAGNATVSGDVLPEADGTRSVGAIATRMAAVHTDSLFVSPATLYSASYAVTATETFVLATGASAEASITLPNATTVAGRMICVQVSDTTTNNVIVKVATSGKIGNSAAPNGDGGTAGATGVTASANYACGCWVSDGTDYDLVLHAGGTWASP